MPTICYASNNKLFLKLIYPAICFDCGIIKDDINFNDICIESPNLSGKMWQSCIHNWNEG